MFIQVVSRIAVAVAGFFITAIFYQPLSLLKLSAPNDKHHAAGIPSLIHKKFVEALGKACIDSLL